jgi:hypothetical protein
VLFLNGLFGNSVIRCVYLNHYNFKGSNILPDCQLWHIHTGSSGDEPKYSCGQQWRNNGRTVINNVETVRYIAENMCFTDQRYPATAHRATISQQIWISEGCNASCMRNAYSALICLDMMQHESIWSLTVRSAACRAAGLPLASTNLMDLK